MKTIQINIRISEPLVQEINQVSGMLKINKADWIRLTLAREAFEERNKLLTEIKEIEEIMESDVGKVFKEIRKRAHERR